MAAAVFLAEGSIRMSAGDFERGQLFDHDEAEVGGRDDRGRSKPVPDRRRAEA